VTTFKKEVFFEKKASRPQTKKLLLIWASGAITTNAYG